MDREKSKRQVADLVEKLEKGIADLFDSDKYQQYLQTIAKFHKYSYRNVMLILLQREDASMVAGFNAWKTKFGRTVKRGEKGIAILAPAPYKRIVPVPVKDDDGNYQRDDYGRIVREEKEVTIPAFKAVYVFDIAQTEGQTIPELTSDIHADVHNYSLFFESLKTVASCPVDFEDLPKDTHGYYHRIDNRIAICGGMSESQTIKTLIHEIAHFELHKADDPSKDRRTKEVEAESVAYIVCAHYGIDTSEYSFGYIAGWSGDKELPQLQSSMSVIQQTAGQFIEKIDETYLAIEKKLQIESQAQKMDQRLEHAYSELMSESSKKDIEERVI